MHKFSILRLNKHDMSCTFSSHYFKGNYLVMINDQGWDLQRSTYFRIKNKHRKKIHKNIIILVSLLLQIDILSIIHRWYIVKQSAGKNILL